MSLPAVRIVRAGLGDVDLVAALFDAYRRFYGQASDLVGAREFVGQRVSRDESVIFLALTGFGPGARGVGFTQLYPSFTSVGMKRIWILNDLFVDEAGRRGGVGGLLMDRAEDFARKDGAARLVLQTAVENGAARGLYEKRGWELETAFVQYKKRL